MDAVAEQSRRQSTPLLFAILFGIICLIVAYLLIWQRGFYIDDYELSKLPISFNAMRTNGARFLSSISITGLLKLLPEHEFLFRTLIAIFAGCNALLLGVLSASLTQSRLAGILACWLFLAPVWGSEALLWATASVSYLLNTFFVLLYVYLAYRGFKATRYAWYWIAGAILAFFIALNFVEFIVSAVMTLPFLLLIVRWQSKQSWSSLFLRFGALILVPAILSVSYFLAFYRNLETSFERQGSFLLHPAELWQHIRFNYLAPLYLRTFHPLFGRNVITVGLRNGVETLFSSPQGIVLIVLAIICLLIFIVQWKSERRRSANRVIILLIVMSVFWSVASLFVPTAFMSSQILTTRLIYLPLSALSLGIACLLVLLPHQLQRLSLLLIGCLTLVFSLIMLGFSRSYSIRYLMDSYTMDSLNEIVPLNSIPQGTHIITSGIRHELVSVEEDIFANLQLAVFEYAGAAELMSYAQYNRRDLDFLASNRWAGNQVNLSCNTPEILRQGNLCATGINEPSVIDDQATFIMITMQNDILFVVDALHFQFSDETIVVNLPLADWLAERGTRLLDHVVIEMEG